MFKILEKRSSFYIIILLYFFILFGFSAFLIVICKLFCRAIWPAHPLCDHKKRAERLAWHFSWLGMTEHTSIITAHKYDTTAAP